MAPSPRRRHEKATSAADLVRAASGDDELAARIEENAKRKALVHCLFAIRSAKGVSQAEMAERLECSQSRVSKLENDEDDDLRLGDVRRYLRALDHDLMLVVGKRRWTLVEQVKFFAASIAASLRKMVGLAEGDEQIQDGVSRFHVEAFCNLVRIVLASAKNIPQSVDPAPPLVATGDFGEMDDPAHDRPGKPGRSLGCAALDRDGGSLSSP